MYESAVRASELLSMTIENTSFAENGKCYLTVRGKTGTRRVSVLMAVPALKAWTDVHPIGKGKMWVSLRRPHEVLSYPRLYNLTMQTIERAELQKDKKRILHMFRHTRATELYRLGIRGLELSQFMGWTKKSNMEATYSHLSPDDMDNAMDAKVYRMDQEREPQRPMLSAAVCPHCGEKNDPTARICSKCNLSLEQDAFVQSLIQRLVASPDVREILRVAIVEAVADETRRGHKAKPAE